MTIYDLSTYPHIKYVLNTKQVYEREYYFTSLLLKYDIFNYGLLEERINSGDEIFQNPYFSLILRKAYENLAKCNKQAITAPTFKFDAYENSEFNPEILSETDQKNSCLVLPFNSPLTRTQAMAERLKNINIKEAKEMLATYGSSSKNALEMCVASFGHAKSIVLASLIPFYEEQIIRTAATIEDLESYDGNLFKENFSQKRSLVANNISEICNALLSQGDQFIWGEMDQERKDSLRSKINSPQNKKDFTVYINFINTISSYTTLPELENPLTRKRAIERFIIK